MPKDLIAIVMITTLLLPFVPRRGTLALIVPAVLLTSWPSTQAAKSVFERTKPHVNVGSIGHVDLVEPPLSFDFRADLEAGAYWPTSGGILISFGDGSVVNLRPVAGRIVGYTEPDQLQVSFVLLPVLPTREFDVSSPVVAEARPHPSVEGRLLWELSGSPIGGEPLRFDVEGVIQRIWRSPIQPPAPAWFSLRYAPQRVAMRQTELSAGFYASARVRHDRSARGRIVLELPDGQPPLRFEPVFGQLEAATANEPSHIVLLLAGEGPMFELEDLLIATVRPDPALPGRDLWDLRGGQVSDSDADQFLIQFDAEGEVRFHRPPSSRTTRNSTTGAEERSERTATRGSVRRTR